MPPCYRGLIWLGRARRAGGTNDNFTDGIAELYCLDIIATGFPSSCQTKIHLFVCKEQVVIFRYRRVANSRSGYYFKNQLLPKSTGGPLLTRFFETLEKQPCKQKTV